MGTNELQVTLSCGCGRSVVARAKDAGGTISCTCGKHTAVPRLSELRALAGTDAYVTNPAEAIRKLHAQGVNPAGNRCLLCGSMSPDIYNCLAVCEESYILKGTANEDYSLPKLFLSLLFLPRLLLVLMMALRKKDAMPDERRGHDVVVDFTLPVCGACAATSGGVTRPKVARQLMTKAPALAELVAFYPSLKLEIERRR